MEDQTFTFSWEVKNFSLCTKERGLPVRSENFDASNMYNTEWTAFLYPRAHDDPDFISLYLRRYDKGFDSAGLRVTFQIVAADGTPGNEITVTVDISKTTFGLPKYATRSDVERLYLHKDTLKIQCVFRKINELNLERWFAFTASDADVQTIYKVFALTNFSHVKEGILLYESVRLQEGSEILFDVQLSIDGGPGRQELRIQFTRRYDHSRKPLSLNTLIMVLNAQGKASEIWKQDHHVFHMRTPEEVWQFPTFIKMAPVMRQKNNYLVNDVLNLKCEITLSSEIMTSDVEVTSFSVETDTTEDTNSVDMLTEHMKDLYNSKRFADVNLRVSGETVPVHRIVLQSRSKKFAEMLDVDVLTDNVLDVPDVDMITLQRMLKYMYTDEIDDLEYEDAVVAYITAQKYRIETLKCKYSFVLQSQLKVSNVCTILMHADDFCDHVLQNFAVDFIEQYWHCVGLSEDLEELSKERPLLAQKTKEQLSRTAMLSNTAQCTHRR